MKAKRSLTWVAVGLESAVDVTAVCAAIIDPEYRAMIGGGVCRLAAVALLARLSMLGRNWARLVLVGIEAFTALLALFFLCIVMTSSNVPRVTGMVIVSCAGIFYAMLAVAFWVGLRPQGPGH